MNSSYPAVQVEFRLLQSKLEILGNCSLDLSFTSFLIAKEFDLNPSLGFQLHSQPRRTCSNQNVTPTCVSWKHLLHYRWPCVCPL